MIWLRLKLDLLPCISQEVDKVSKDYMNLVEEARKGDKASYQNLISLQTEIRNRIDEFDRFYEKNYSDFRIAYFEKLKLRLRKLLSSNIDVNVFIQEEQRNQAKKNEEKSMRSPPGHVNKKTAHTENAKYTSPPMKDLKEKQEKTKQANPSKTIPNTSVNSSQSRPQTQPIPGKKAEKNNLESTLPTKKIPATNTQTTPIKSTTPNKTPLKKTPPKTGFNESKPIKKSPMQAINQAEKPNKNKANDDVVFMIKMTKEEYMEYQAAKNKKK